MKHLILIAVLCAATISTAAVPPAEAKAIRANVENTSRMFMRAMARPAEGLESESRKDTAVAMLTSRPFSRR